MDNFNDNQQDIWHENLNIPNPFPFTSEMIISVWQKLKGQVFTNHRKWRHTESVPIHENNVAGCIEAQFKMKKMTKVNSFPFLLLFYDFETNVFIL